MEMHIPVSIGELIDKITILQIKASRFQGEALAHVQQELNLWSKCILRLASHLDRACQLLWERPTPAKVPDPTL
jgi:hypothetical protein